jgi:hypothetical protein
MSIQSLRGLIRPPLDPELLGLVLMVIEGGNSEEEPPNKLESWYLGGKAGWRGLLGDISFLEVLVIT